MAKNKLRNYFSEALKKLSALVVFFAMISAASHSAYAVVGKAERYDEFDEETLREYHKNILAEEESTADKEKRNEQIESLLEKQMRLKKEHKLDPEIDKDLDALKMQLLSLPKRDRFQFESQGDYKYNSNVDRAPIQKEKRDSIMSTRQGIRLDMSGKKTDLRFGLDAGKKWNIKRSESDEMTINESLNYRRRYFKKVSHSLQTKVARHNQKTVEINSDKIRWDFGANSSYNFPFSRKFSTNTTFTADKRYFSQEKFDQDSSWEATAVPGLFWNVTPKSRTSLSYSYGANRIRSKSGDTNAHLLHLGYFGQVTRKSSTSVDLSAGYQTPQSLESPRSKQYSAGIGYIWQWTPKTQLTFQLIRSIQNTTSELVSGSTDENKTSKTDVYFSNSAFSLSINSRLTRKLSAAANFGLSYFHNTTNASGSNADIVDLKDTETGQLTLPLSLLLTYNFNPKVALNIGYSFSYRDADEKPDSNRVHELTSSMRVLI